MSKQLLKDIFVWGFLLWVVGYILGIVLFMMVPANLIGWVITPMGILITCWVLFNKIHSQIFREYIILGLGWALIAVFFDYFLLVKLFKPADGYYKLDVYLYYVLTFVMPLIAGYIKGNKAKP